MHNFLSRRTALAGSAALGLAVAILSSGLAQAGSRLRAYQASDELRLVFFASDAFDCATPAAMRARMTTHFEMLRVREKMAALAGWIQAAAQSGDPVDTRTVGDDLESLQTDVYPHLWSIAVALDRLPPCPESLPPGTAMMLADPSPGAFPHWGGGGR